jgi:hypothetical protein
MDQAVCWEISLVSGPAQGCRVLVADRFVATQPLFRGNGRPRWIVEEQPGREAAMGRALDITGHLEAEHGAALVASPVRVRLREEEVAGLAPGAGLPVSLRTRAFSALYRGRR